ncbi:MAG: radical SAM protein [Candidatus Omnitrophota bacterium]
MDHRGNVWYEKEKVLDFIHANEGFISFLADAVISFDPQVIGLSVQSTSKFFALELASCLRKKSRDKVLIFGGPLVFSNCYGSDILNDYPFLDAISLGEAEQAFPMFLSIIDKKRKLEPCEGFAIRSGTYEVLEGAKSPPIKDLDTIPFADFSDFEITDYTKKLIPIATSRGCINHCSYCNESPQWIKYRRRSPQKIIQEIEFQLSRYPHIDTFWLNDSLINGDMKMLGDLCDLLIARKLAIRWGGQAMVRKEMTKDFLAKMKKAGCYLLSYGVENGSDKILRLMRKPHTAALAKTVIRDTHESGVGAIFNIIVGFPGEDEESFLETKNFILDCRSYVMHIELPTYLLLKGSYVYDNIEEFNIAPLDFKDDWQLKWKTLDSRNTYEIRKHRVEEILNRAT